MNPRRTSDRTQGRPERTRRNGLTGPHGRPDITSGKVLTKFQEKAVIRAQERALATEKILEDPREKLDRTKGKTIQVSSKKDPWKRLNGLWGKLCQDPDRYVDMPRTEVCSGPDVSCML
jgi:hypothetical protein